MRIGVVGAGIGGLTTALALATRHHEVTVFERAAAFGEVGAGIQVSPNAARVLHDVGLGEALDAIAVRPERVVLRRWRDDSELGSTVLGEPFRRRYGLPYANVARPDLVDVLAEAVAASPSIDVRFGARVSGVTVDEAAATVHLLSGATDTFDVVVGCDGIHSTVRSAVLGEHPSRFSNTVAFRALVPRERVEHLPVEVTNRLGPDRHVVSYFIGRNRRHLNLVFVAPEADWTTESWTEPGSLDQLRSLFDDWSPDLRHLFDLIDEPIHRWALHDREPLAEWGRGRVTLAGDACHPMLPFMAQGACQAIEDAAVLGRCLDDAGRTGVTAALRRYEDNRRERTATVQRLSWRNRDVFHLPDGEQQQARDAAFARIPPDAFPNDWLYGFHPMTEPLG